MPILAHSDTARLDDPEPSANGLGGEETQEVADECLQQAQRRIPRRSQDGDSWCTVGRETQDIGEVGVEGEKAAVLPDARFERSLVAGSAESLLQNGFGVIASAGKKVSQPCGSRSSRPASTSCCAAAGKIHESFAAHLGAVGDGGKQIFSRELRILAQDFFHGRAGREEIQQKRDPDARAPDARLATADLGIHRDAVQEIVHRFSRSASQDTSARAEPVPS